MFGSRSLSRAATKGGIRHIPLLKPVSPTRSLSSIASRPILSTSRSDRLRLQASSYLPPASVSGLAFARFNSTTSAAATNATPALDNDIPSIEEIPEGLGYLKELGLDYGWGPSAFMEWSIEHVHVLTGMPWWASIVTIGCLTRLALLKPSLMAADNAARTVPVRDKLLQLRKDRLQLHSQGLQLEAAKLKLEMDNLTKEHGISTWKNFITFIQIPLSFGVFRVVRGMTLLPVPALATEQFAWIHEFTVHDPTYILPALTTVFMYYSMKLGLSSAPGGAGNSSLGRNMIYGLPALSLLFMVWQPAAIQLSFATTGFLALIQAYLINTPVTRAWLGVAAVSRQAPSGDGEKAESLRMIKQHVINQAKDRLRESGAEISASAQKPDVSIVDKVVNNTKNEFSKMRKEMNDKVAEFAGTSDNAPQSRLTETEKRTAESYKAQREIDDAHDLAERNRKRTQEYEAFLAQQQNTPARSWQSAKRK